MQSHTLTSSLSYALFSLSGKERFIYCIATTTFFWLFLIIFQPFGVNNYDPTESINATFLFGISIFSAALFLLLLIDEYLINYFFEQTDQFRTYLKLILLRIFVSLLFIGSGLFIVYNILGEFHDFNLSSYFQMVLNMSLMLLFTIAARTIYGNQNLLRSSLEKEYNYLSVENDEDQLITIIAENEKDQLILPLKSIVYIQSEDNYISVHHLENERIKHKLIRKSLKSFINELSLPLFLRTHRSYIVNLMHVQKIDGNRNRMSISLKYLDNDLPVGRSYITAVMNAVNQ